MDFTTQIWDTAKILGVMRELKKPEHYWMTDEFYKNALTSDDEYVDMNKFPDEDRRLAPFVAPLLAGKPVYKDGARLARFKPGYIKALDGVSPTTVFTKSPENLLNMAPQTPGSRYNARKVSILQQHLSLVHRRWEWMAAKAIIDGKVVIGGEDGTPESIVDFGRAANQDVTLAQGARFGDAGVSIVDFIQGALDTMHSAEFGGAGTRITIGTEAWKVMRRDPELLKLMDKTIAGSTHEMKRGLIGTGEVRWVGMFDGQLDMYVYNDFYKVGNTTVPFMDPRDIVITSPAINGYRCFGAIQDARANFQPLPIFSRNWLPEGDPSIEQLLTQSAPIFVPTSPNGSFRARVVQ